MPTTPTYGWSTPVDTSVNDVPADLASLASQVEAALSAALGRLPVRMAAGSFSGGQRTGASYTATINFPAGRFTVAPIVTATVDNSASGASLLQLVVGTVTSSTAELIFLSTSGNLSNAYCTATWQAVQMTPTTAAG